MYVGSILTYNMYLNIISIDLVYDSAESKEVLYVLYRRRVFGHLHAQHLIANKICINGYR